MLCEERHSRNEVGEVIGTINLKKPYQVSIMGIADVHNKVCSEVYCDLCHYKIVSIDRNR